MELLSAARTIEQRMQIAALEEDFPGLNQKNGMPIRVGKFRARRERVPS
jgi:hypothetical protein